MDKTGPCCTKAEKRVVEIEKKEPLKEAALHFLQCITERCKPKTNGLEALAVLKVVQRAQEYLDRRDVR